jgi:2,4-dienoyl-CoA reductase-like NADH-dependent reductase (Old Yellow Enzyme family)
MIRQNSESETVAGLLDAITIRHLELKNRIVLPPMATSKSRDDGAVTSLLVDHYLGRARAGVGLIIVEHAYVLPAGKASRKQLGIHQDALLPGLKELAQAVHQAGSKVGIQINHAGSRTSAELIGAQPLAPSDVLVPGDEEVPRSASADELEEISSAFASAARRAVQAGFDFVEVHGAHGFLLSEFLSPYTNRRSDAYGGSFENRCRFPLEVVSKVRQAIGQDFILFYRLGADDLIPGGLTIRKSARFASLLAAAGVDCIDVSGGLCGSRPEHLQSIQGYFVPLAEAIKREVDIPVIVAGGITEPEFADKFIRARKVDLVAIGRAQLKDPDWAARAREVLG